MNLGAAKVVLRPRTVGEVIDLAALVTTRGAPRLLATVAAVVLAPGFLLTLALRYLADLSWPEVWLVAWLWTSIATGAFTVAVGRWLLAEEATVGAVLKEFFRRLPGFLLTWSLAKLFLIPAALFGAPMVIAAVDGSISGADTGVFFVLGLFVAMLIVPAQQQTLFVYETVFLERLGAGRAIGRSRQFVRALGGRAWKMALLTLSVVLVAAGVGEVIGQSLLEDVLMLGPLVEHLRMSGGSPFALAGVFAATPFLAAARFLFYVDGRTRVDGWDIQVKFLAIAVKAEHPSLRSAA